jgi:transglutaminase-like putative cysteine protease
MQDIIEAKYIEWTDGLTPEESTVNIFDKIRDIPYYVIAEHLDLEKGPSGMLKENKGSCTPKHYLLGMMYQRLGVDVRYHTYSFMWKDLDIEYSGVLKDLSERIPVTYHLACEAFLGERWVLLDATWDKGLAGTDFPVNENWDGKSNTILAIKSINDFIHEDAAKRDKEIKEKTAAYSLPEKLELSRFSGELNKWLDQIRKEK